MQALGLEAPRQRSGTYRLVAAWTAVLALVVSLALPVGTLRAQTDTDEGGVSGNTYISPDFGYSISWDSSWDVVDEQTTENPAGNSLTLQNRGSQVVIGGSAEQLSGGECVEELLTGVESSEAAGDLEAVEENLDDEPASGVYTVDLTFEDNPPVNFTIYLQCEPILDGDAVLYVMHFAPSTVWEEQVPEREELLENLRLEGEPADTTEEDADAAEPDDDATGEEDASGPLSVAGGDGERPANEDELVTLIDASITDINDFWSRQYPVLSGGEPYEPPAWVTWTGDVETGCGTYSSVGPNGETGSGPFYCSLDKTIYLDLNFANFQLEIVPNKFVIPVVMAHEAGHHVQWELGLKMCEETPCLDPDRVTSLEIEYMADCFGGAWARDAEQRNRLGSLDIDANIQQYSIILSGGQESADLGNHGRSSERVWWFLNGYLEGAAKCLETSEVTADLLDETSGGDETPVATEAPDTDADADADTTETTGTTADMNEVVELDGLAVEVLRTRVRDAIDDEQADEGQFVVVYFEATVDDGADGPFPYADWTLVDSAGNAYEFDEDATNQLLSGVFGDGVDEELEGGASYRIAVVYDVPTDASGLSLVNESQDVSITLDI